MIFKEENQKEMEVSNIRMKCRLLLETQAREDLERRRQEAGNDDKETKEGEKESSDWIDEQTKSESEDLPKVP